MLTIGDKVKVKDSDIQGVVTDIDKHHPKVAIRIKITKGESPVTDYYLDELEQVY